MPEDVDIEQVKSLVKLVEEHNLAELTVEEHGVTITVKGASQEIHSKKVEAVEEEIIEHEIVQAAEEPVEDQEDSSLVKIEALMVGVFYRAPSPDSPPFVDVGDTIEIGQTIGLIEAMKVFSEIPAEIAGVIVDIPAENGKLVQQGQPLIVVRPA